MPKTIEETREYGRNYWRENAERLNAQSRERYQKSSELRKQISERSKVRRKARTPEKVEADALRDKKYKRANPEVSARAVKKCSKLKRAKFNLLKLGRPCYDCGGMFPLEAMDWDHRPGVIKCFDISRGVRSHSEEAVIDEINKCQLVCATCHRLRTINRKKEKI